MNTTLSPQRLHCSHPSLPCNLRTRFATSVNRLLPAAAKRVSPPNPQFALEYLIQSCGLSSNEAIRASIRIQHLKSPDKPDAVLQFLRQAGVSESDIKMAVSRDPRLLCCNMENNLIPNIAKLQEVGWKMEDISGMISQFPSLFVFNIVPKIDFWLRALGSADDVMYIVTRRPALLCSNLEKVIIPNLSFLREQCGLSVHQIVRLIMMSPFLLQNRPEILQNKAKRVEEFGIARNKRMFMYGLVVVSSLNQTTINAKIRFFRSFGLSQEEVNFMFSKAPQVFMKSEELITRKMKFLTKEAGCDEWDVVHNPALLNLSLEKRLIPRSLVRKLLKSRGLPAGNQAFVSFVQINEKQFLEKFVLPYEFSIPGLHQAYVEACAGKIGAIEQLTSISS